MPYNLISNVESCYIDLPALLYYSHWPSIIISLLFGVFVFLKSGRSLLGKILLSISISYSLWAILNLTVWITVDSETYSFFWSFFETLSVLFYFLVLYFGYVFIEEKDISFKSKLLFLIFFTPVAIISSTKYYLSGFDAISCDAITNEKFLYFIYFLKGAVFFGLLVLIVSKLIKYRKNKVRRRKISVVGSGLVFLLLSFLFTQFVGDLISADYYEIEFYGLFAIDVFIGFLAYSIVKFKAFNVKLIGAQALVVAQFALIGSMLFFSKSLTNQILTGITLVITSGAGWFLIQSVKKEVERKEQLQKISDALIIANQRLKELDLTKSEFISIASHQLRTPLTAIKGYISLLLEGSYGVVSAPVLDILNKLYSVNNRLVHLVEDLLNVSRIEAGRIQYSFAPTQLEPIITELVDMFKPSAKEKNLTLTMKLSKIPLPLITIDPNKIKEVVSNLIDNAVKYTKEGGVTVSLESTSDMARITVSDTGIGIHDEDKKNLFQKFLRSKETTKMVVSGAGLGLYVGKSFIEAHGGKIWAESDGEGKGSRFIIELPLKNTKIHIGTSDELSHSEKA